MPHQCGAAAREWPNDAQGGVLCHGSLHDLPIPRRLARDRLALRVIANHQFPDTLTGAPQDLRAPEHGVTAAGACAIAIEGDAQPPVRRERPAAPAQIANAIALRPRAVDLILHARGHVVVETRHPVARKETRRILTSEE